MAEIHAALEKPDSSVSVREPGFRTVFQNLSTIVRLLDGQSREPGQAWSATLDLFRLSRLLGKIPSSGIEQSRLPILHHAVVALEWAIRHESSDATLRAMRKKIASTRDPEHWPRCLAAQRCLPGVVFHQVFTFRAWGRGRPGLDWQQAVLLAWLQLSRLTGSSQSECADLIEAIDRMVPVVREPLPRAFDLESKILQPPAPGRFPSPFTGLWQALGRTDIERAKEEAFYRLADTALAIAEYRLAHEGALPKNLNALVPKLVPSVPTDPFDGQPLRYRASQISKHWLLYSVGENRADDGGADNLALFRPSGPWTYDPLDLVVRFED